MKNDYDRSVALLCPTCASDQLQCMDEVETELSRYRCAACDGEFNYAELKVSNAERIEAAIDEMKSEIVSDIEKDFAKIFKKF